MKEPTSIKMTTREQNWSVLLISQECVSNQCAVVKEKTKFNTKHEPQKPPKKHNHNMKLHETLKGDGKVQVNEKKDDGNEVGWNNNEEKRICLHKAISGVAVGQGSFSNDAQL